MSSNNQEKQSDEKAVLRQSLRNIPSVEAILQDERLVSVEGEVPRQIIVDAVRREVETLRESLLAGKRLIVVDETTTDDQIEERFLDVIIQAVQLAVAELNRPQYRKVINGTGVILHTGLGRAVLPRAAVARIASELDGYSLLQVDVETGKRGKRDERIEWLLQRLTGAEAATVVNNNAAATSIVLNTVGQGREVIVSRGQLVEIGGSFRLPDVMELSGAKLVEVGTTNKTHPRDYENAITENTAALLRVHPSNYRIQGFTSETSLEDMIAIGRKHDIPVIDDLGAGALVDLAQFGFEREPLLSESLAAGADLVTCSGDKLVGSGQGGIILGTKRWVEAVRKNQFARIVRPGKLTLAAIEATLALFLDQDVAIRNVPTLMMLARTTDDLDQQALRIASAIESQSDAATTSVEDGFSRMGSGSLPTQEIPTRLATVAPKKCSAETLATRLRHQAVPVFVRVKEDRIMVDPRTILDGEDYILIEAIVEALDIE
jgi:L-seryl-tRNA(Ser) seleniumtransferase